MSVLAATTIDTFPANALATNDVAIAAERARARPPSTSERSRGELRRRADDESSAPCRAPRLTNALRRAAAPIPRCSSSRAMRERRRIPLDDESASSASRYSREARRISHGTIAQPEIVSRIAGARRLGISNDATRQSTNRRDARLTTEISRRATVLRIGPARVRNERRPAGTKRILIVRIGAEPLEQLVILAELVAIELHAESRRRRHGDRPVRSTTSCRRRSRRRRRW